MFDPDPSSLPTGPPAPMLMKNATRRECSRLRICLTRGLSRSVGTDGGATGERLYEQRDAGDPGSAEVVTHKGRPVMSQARAGKLPALLSRRESIPVILPHPLPDRLSATKEKTRSHPMQCIKKRRRKNRRRL
jgi:hypothetical protein